MQRQLLACLVMTSFPAAAQSTRGSISGRVLDPGGSPAAGVNVVATNESTNAKRQQQTNEAGLYRLTLLEPGNHQLEFSKGGFQTARFAERIAIDSTEEKVVNHTLVLAPLTDQISVEGTPPGVQLSKTSPTIDRIVPPAVIDKVPLTGTLERDVNSLMALSPTAVRRGSGEFLYVAAGQRWGKTEFLVDGLDNRTQGIDFAWWRPIPEQISEFQVKINPYSAEFGRASGGVVSMITRSGGNQLHGSVWDYYNASWMSAKSLGNKRAGLGLPRFQEHDAGASLAGPLRRDRTFVFGMFQGRPMSSGLSVVAPPVTIPTRAGYDALARLPLAEGQSAEDRRSILSTLGFLRDAYPLISRYENVALQDINGMPVEIGTTQLAAPNQALVVSGLLRLDHRLSSRDSVTFRSQTYSIDEDVARSGRARLSNAAFGALFASRFRIRSNLLMASHTRILSSSTVNEFRFGVNLTPVADAIPNRDGPAVVVNQTTAFGGFLLSPWKDRWFPVQWQDVLTFQRGRHAVKFGADMLRYDYRNQNANFTRGLWLFQSWQDVLNGRPFLLKYQREPGVSETKSLQQAYFIQEDFRAAPNVTLNFGLRYQTAGAPLAVFGTTSPDLLAAGIPRPVRRDTNDLAPRFGFAWSPSERTVLRGGLGITFEQSVGSPGVFAFFNTYPQAIQISEFPPPPNQYPVIPAGGSGPPPLLPGLYDFTSPSPRAKNPTTHFYSFSIQRELTRNDFVEAGYVGNRAYHLWRLNESNPAVLTTVQAALARDTRDSAVIPGVAARRLNPAWASRQLGETDGFSNYNAGFLRYDRRAGWGLQFGGTYTWSAALDDGEGPPQDPRNFRRDYARANIDRPHRFSAHWAWTGPSFARRHGILKHAAGGWQIAGYAEFQSGEPFTVTTGVDSNGDGVSTVSQFTDRPDFNPAGLLTLDPLTGDWRSFRTPSRGGVFVTPLDVQGSPLANSVPFGGNLGRNTFRSPAYSNVHVSVLKEIAAGERARIEVRGSWSNLFNHRNFGPPVAIMNAPDFGMNSSNPEARVTILAIKMRF